MVNIKAKSLYHSPKRFVMCIYIILPESDFYIHKVSVFSSVFAEFFWFNLDTAYPL